jgi:cytochrome P450
MITPPGPRGLPLIGNTLELLDDPLGFITRISSDYGDVVRFRLLHMNVYLLNHPDAIEEILRTASDHFIKDDFTRRLSIAVGNGLLTSEGDTWRRQRKLAQPAFHHHRVRAYGDAMVRHAARLASRYAPGETRDVHADMMRLTLDIVAETLFGADIGGVADEIGAAMETLSERFAGAGVLVPLWIPTPENRRVARALTRLDEIVYGLIRERRSSGTDRGDLLSMLLAATTDEGGGMSDRQLRDEVVTLMLAGHETTALALTFAHSLLGQHPRALEELVAEIARVLGERAATVDDLPNLPYADGVIRESLRLYPPAWALGREATRPCRIAGYDIEPGTQFWLAQWVVHRDPRWFPNPLAFEPERWKDDLAKRLPRFAYFPFGGGPRFCIGNAFAMMEAVLLLVTLVQRVTFRLADNRPLELSPSVTLRPKNGLAATVERKRC